MDPGLPHLTDPHLSDPRLVPLVAPSRAFYDGRPVRRGPASRDELLAVRASSARPKPAHPPPVEEVAEADGRRVPVRIHVPAELPARGALLELHGGGFYTGSAADSDLACRRLADDLGVAVVSVDYRLAPEHPWPAAPDDCEAAALWLVEHAEDRFGGQTLGVTGFSAGSTLALGTLLRLRERGVSAYDVAVLQFGTYDLSGRTPAGRLIADEYFLEAYAGAVHDRTQADVSPIFADTVALAALPPILMLVGERDVLLHDNLAMARRLGAAGVEIELRVYPDSPHGFTRHPTPMATAALADVDAWLAGRLPRRSRPAATCPERPRPTRPGR